MQLYAAIICNYMYMQLYAVICSYMQLCMVQCPIRNLRSSLHVSTPQRPHLPLRSDLRLVTSARPLTVQVEAWPWKTCPKYPKMTMRTPSKHHFADAFLLEK